MEKCFNKGGKKRERAFLLKAKGTNAIFVNSSRYKKDTKAN